MKKLLKKKKWIIIGGLVALIAIYLIYSHFFSNAANNSVSYTPYKVTKRDINTTLSGSAAVTSSYRQDLSAKVSGTIKNVFFKEGDTVKAGDLLVEFDDSQASNNLEKTKLSMQQAENNINTCNENISNLNIKAPISGQVSNLALSEGDNINNGTQVFTVTDTKHLKLSVPFNQVAASTFYAGQQATVYIQDYMDTITGTISYIDNSSSVVDGGGRIQNVEISIINPGALKAGIKASASIENDFSTDNGTIDYANVSKVRAQVNGTVQKLNVRENQYVNAGQVLITLKNDDLYTQLDNAKMNYRNLQLQYNTDSKNLEDYKIYAVHDGIIVKQDSKAGDFVQDGAVITSISNPGAMQFDIGVDELDISKVQLGQEANVTIDALPNQTFKGIVTAIANEGTSSNGVTTYPVTIDIQNPQGIKEGMNANAEIIISSKQNVLSLPTSAVQTMGTRGIVLVSSGNSKANSGNRSNVGNGYANYQNANGVNSNYNSGNSQNTRSNNQNFARGQNGGNGRNKSITGISVTSKMVTVGISNDDYVEIVSGLNEGDTVYVAVKKSISSSGTQNSSQGFGFGGGMMGGGGVRMYTGGSNNNRSSSSGSSNRNNSNTSSSSRSNSSTSSNGSSNSNKSSFGD